MTLLVPLFLRRKGSHIHLQIRARVSNQPSLPTYCHKTNSPQMAEGTLMLKFEFALILLYICTNKTSIVTAIVMHGFCAIFSFFLASKYISLV